MLFFKSLAVFSTLAFGAMSALAAPAASPVENGLVARCDCQTVSEVLTGLKASISVSVDALAALTPDTCTESEVTLLVSDIKLKVAAATRSIMRLAGQPADVILGGDVDVKIIASLVANILLYVFAAVRVVMNVCLAANLRVCLALLVGLGEVIAGLVSAVLSVTADLLVGLDVAILGLIGAVVDVIVKLNITLCISVLGITL